MQTVTIIGIGHVGRLILQGLLQHPTPLYINLVDIGDAAPGYAIDAMHAALIDGQHKVFFDSRVLSAESDYIFHCAGPSVPAGADRSEISTQSKAVTQAIFSNKEWKTSAKVIVITNPVEAVCKYVSEFSGIHAQQVFGTGTSIDTIRLQYFLAKEFIVQPHKVQTMMVGEHGGGMVALLSQSIVDGIKLTNNRKWKSAVLQAKNAATTIKTYTGYTSFGPAQAALELWKVISGLKTSTLPFSFANSSKAIPGHPNLPSWFSLPIRVSNQSNIAILPDSITDSELSQMLLVADKLVESAKN